MSRRRRRGSRDNVFDLRGGWYSSNGDYDLQDNISQWDNLRDTIDGRHTKAIEYKVTKGGTRIDTDLIRGHKVPVLSFPTVLGIYWDIENVEVGLIYREDLCL